MIAASALLAQLAVTGCAVRVGYYRAYDPYHRDYHYFDDHEHGYYNQWSIETRRDAHRDFRRLDKDEQRQYWDWRHQHPDR